MNDEPWHSIEQPSCFNDLFNTRFHRLEYLELRYLLRVDTQLLQDYLENHASTMRELRLIECCLSDRAGEQDKLAEWAGENMHLAGVEVLMGGDIAILAQVNAAYTGEIELDEEVERLAKGVRERIESREAKYLNGRPTNTLTRTVDIADRSIPIEQWKQEWWRRPCRM